MDHVAYLSLILCSYYLLYGKLMEQLIDCIYEYLRTIPVLLVLGTGRDGPKVHPGTVYGSGVDD